MRFLQSSRQCHRLILWPGTRHSRSWNGSLITRPKNTSDASGAFASQCGVDVSYINISGTFFHLCSLLDSCSRAIVHWELRETMTEADAEIVLAARPQSLGRVPVHALSLTGVASWWRAISRSSSGCGRPRMCSPSPHYPQSTRTLKEAAISPKAPLCLGGYSSASLASSSSITTTCACTARHRPRDRRGTGWRVELRRSCAPATRTSNKLAPVGRANARRWPPR